MAAVKPLPVVFVCENNQYAQFTAIGEPPRIETWPFGPRYGFPGGRLDGNDVGAVFDAAIGGRRRARAGMARRC